MDTKKLSSHKFGKAFIRLVFLIYIIKIQLEINTTFISNMKII